ETDTAIEALILESALIKKLTPPFNVREKDDKSFLYVMITKEKFPRVLLTRGDKRLAPSLTEHHGARSAREREERSVRFSAGYGPFTSAANIRYALKILRRIFPWNIHTFVDSDKFVVSHRSSQRRPCFDYQIGLCPGTCIGTITRADYMNIIRNLVLFFEGKKKKVIASFTKEMKEASKRLEFEKAASFRRRIFALQHIEDTALINDSEVGQLLKVNSQLSFRIEGYDISNISGDSAVGSMVVFIDGAPDRNEYRKFKIKTISGPDDTGMLEEVFRRRFKHIPSAGARLPDGQGWALPDLILVDGGVGQINAAKKILKEYNLKIPLIGMVKGPDRKRTDIIGFIPKETNLKILIRVRDEAHRFAIAYHKKVRGRKFLGK
ncbi:MAG: UvrB/UvrC motif-containing protein, partial [bacterium]|nr:UvrB/UvrC motif-containing protein [bacterium]